MKTREQIEKELDQNIPRDAVMARSGGGSKQLSYLGAWYVIDRLNKVFGNLGWDSETVELVRVNELGDPPAYRCKVRISVTCPAYDENGTIVGFRNVVKEGTGWGCDKSRLNPHEMAVKEAESDALKRAAMKLGISMGLGLYSKTEEFVDETPAPEPRKDVVRPAISKELTADISNKTTEPAPALKRSTVNALISSNSGNLVRRSIKTQQELEAILRDSYNVKTKEELSDSQAQELLTKLKELVNGR